MEEIIKINNVQFNKPDNNKLVLDGITISFFENEIVSILGPSGCGKSVLLKVAAGLLEPISGEVIVRDFNLTKSHRNELFAFKEQTGFVFQEIALISNLNIFDNIALKLRYHTKLTENEIFDKINFWLEKMDLIQSMYAFPAELSISQKRMLGLVRAVIGSPRYVFLDEPTGNLDSYHANLVTQVIKQLKKENTTVIIVTNQVKWASNISDRLIVMADGKIEFAGKYEHMFSDDNKKIKNIIDNIGGENVI
ncbi:MAG: hypothetical protein A2474_05925 [Elusimicrobia bacterium RIFOXYC2_FULL_34_12]|nr:MAG: hypothetical protein A2474_05925 [Elusimicrobia bacterium RIFOXYC2_FULL_34_12]OGS38748.1 MAG: hypothetical protein A2551_00930 [Elusimicrobia bacterium RIFOXYD2_FULL_34_30]